MAVQDKQPIAKANGKSNEQRTGMLLHKEKRKFREVVLNQGSLNRSSGWCGVSLWLGWMLGKEHSFNEGL